MLKIKNKGNSADLYISGDIVDDADGSLYKTYGIAGYEFPKNIKEQLDALDGKDLTVYINSSGGSVPAGVAIANMIARHNGKTKAVVDGWCCSIATQIFFAAKEREIPANAYLMIHKPSTMMAGTADDMRKCADTLDTIQIGLEACYCNAAKDGVTVEQIHEMVDAETWFTGAEAAEYFNINVLDNTAMAAKAGSFMSNFKHVPDNLSITKIQPAEAKSVVEDKQRVAIALALAEGAMTE